jgi:RecJ-like exonuclease
MDPDTPNYLKNSLNETQLYRLSILIAVIGLLTLAGSAKYLKPDKVPVSEITKEMNGEKIRTTGAVSNPQQIKGHLFFDLTWRGDTVKVAEFNSNRQLKKAQRIDVEGSVSMYQGDLQIVASEISSKKR